MYNDRCESFELILNKWSALLRWRIMLDIVSKPRVILVHGEFDSYTVEYVRFLQDISRQGTHLVVGVSGESCIYPINERIEILQSCRYVHFVQQFNSYELHRLINVVKPHLTLHMSAEHIVSRQRFS